MSDAVENVALALKDESGDLLDADSLKLARAAIQALRTPSPAILKILQEGLVMDGLEPHPRQPEKIWDRCIDALLGEGNP